ncbi:MAG: hypothetical protein WB990_01675, partial [Candidatus Acidiferrales bacterium]
LRTALGNLNILRSFERMERALPRAPAMPFVIVQFALRTESLATLGTPVLSGHAGTPIENLCADLAATLILVSRVACPQAIGESV